MTWFDDFGLHELAVVPSLEEDKTKLCFHLFKKLNCVHVARPHRGHNGSDEEEENEEDEEDEEDEEEDVEETVEEVLAIDDEVGRLNEDKMMAHILDCVAAVCEAQRARVALKKPLKMSKDGEALTPEQQAARNKVFRAALSLAAEGLTHDGAAIDGDRGNAAVRQLMHAFPNKSRAKGGRRWLPLHWAVVAATATSSQQHVVTEADVKAVYGVDPAALCRHHLECETYDVREASSQAYICKSLYGLTPAHLLCLLETTERTKALVRYFAICRPSAFTMNVSYEVMDGTDEEMFLLSLQRGVFGALHVACGLGQPSEWLLQQLMQLDISACRGRAVCEQWTEQWAPLGALCQYSEHIDERLMRCLLAVDSSVDVVVSGFWGAVENTRQATGRVAAVTLLLEANPLAARRNLSNACTLAHCFCSNSGRIPAQECIDILKLLLAANKDAFGESVGGDLPIHWLAQHGPVEALEYLLDACPETATKLTADSTNLLHCVVGNTGDFEANALKVAKVRLLCSRYPSMLLHRDSLGQTPLFHACRRSASNESCDDDVVVSTILALCEAGGRELVSIPVVHPTVPDHIYSNWRPLHAFASSWVHFLEGTTPLSPWADAFRMLLRLCPEAANMAGYNLPTYYRRLLYRAVPHLEPEERCRLIWEDRRMAMFLAFSAFPGEKPPLLACLRYENKDLVKHVVSFL